MIRERMDYPGAGFPVRLLGFPAYEDDGVFMPDVGPQGLHRVIALELVGREGLLAGRELRFLRAHLGLSRSECARRLGITRRTLITWEDKGAEALPTPALNHVSVRVILARLLAPDLKLPDNALRAVAHPSRGPLEIQFKRFRHALNVLGEEPPPWELEAFHRGRPVTVQAA